MPKKEKKDECPKRMGNYKNNAIRMIEYHKECKRCLEKEQFERQYRRNPVVKPKRDELVKEILERRAGNRKVATGRLRLKRIPKTEPARYKKVKDLPPTLKKMDDYNTY